jgi:hypothetical protein
MADGNGVSHDSSQAIGLRQCRQNKLYSRCAYGVLSYLLVTQYFP